MMDLKTIGERAAAARYILQKAETGKKNEVLLTAAAELVAGGEEILAANREDIEAAEAAGMHPGLVDRLRLNEERIKGMAEGLEQIAALEDCIGEVLESFSRPNGLQIEKRRVPLGVIGIIYESRPNVTADAFGLCFKTGNAVILKGGSDAIRSNKAITKVLRQALKQCQMPADAVALIEDTDRKTTAAFMKLNEYVDVLIPRGGAGLIKAVVENSTVPVIETGTGNCHIYVDQAADQEMALDIIVNAKTQRIGVCNACESLVVHESIREQFLPRLQERLAPFSVELRGDERVKAVLPDCTLAAEADYGTEYLDYILSVKTADTLTAAIEHINRYSTRHSDCIITADEAAAVRFLNEIDAACVYVNASTRFTDGYEFGFGAEIGISTQKLHARGPMGLKELTSYKYAITGTGQIR